MVRILHVSDTHLGNWQYKSDERRQDYVDAFEQSIDIAIEEDVDAVIHTGDLFHDPNPHSSDLEDACRVIKKLTPHDIPFYAIVGNHERKRKAQWMDVIASLDIAERLGPKPTMVGDVAVYGVDSIRKTQWDSIDSFDLEPAKDASFRLVCMHQLIFPPVSEHLYEYNSGVYTAEDTLDKIDIDVDAVALGDNHVRGIAEEDGVQFFYPGSTEKTAKDEPDVKSVDVLEIEDGTLKRDRKFLETREFTTINLSVIDGMTSNDLEDKLDSYDIEGDVVEVVLTGSTDDAFTNNQVRVEAKRRGAIVVDIVDNRDYNDGIPTLDDVEHNIEDTESVIDGILNDLDLSDTAKEVESIVRSKDDIKTSGVRDKSDDVVEENAPDINGGDNK